MVNIKVHEWGQNSRTGDLELKELLNERYHKENVIYQLLIKDLKKCHSLTTYDYLDGLADKIAWKVIQFIKYGMEKETVTIEWKGFNGMGNVDEATFDIEIKEL